MSSSISLIFQEIVSIIGSSIGKLIMLSILAFTLSIMMKYNYYQRTGIFLFGMIALFNIFFGQGIFYLFWYIFLRGSMGQYIPRGLPSFPYLYSQAKWNNINYLINKEGCNVKKIPQLQTDVGTYKDSTAGILSRLRYFFVQGDPAGSTKDIYLTKNNIVDPIIFGNIDNSKNIDPCQMSYLYRWDLNSWDPYSPLG